MSFDFASAISQALEYCHKELSSIRTGRANPALIEELPVECYGSVSPLQQLAAISAPEPRLLVVQPWDASITKDIEKALAQSSLGINPVVDGKIIRLPIPQMTEERRKDLLKVVNEKAEQTKVRIRGAREEAIQHSRAAEKEGSISQDAAKAVQDDIQRQVDEAIAELQKTIDAKTQELMTV